jgi:hypothetical protein
MLADAGRGRQREAEGGRGSQRQGFIKFIFK